MEKIGCNYLRRLRQQKGKTLSSAAIDMGISVAALSKLERGQVSLTPGMAQILSDYYKMKIKPVRIIMGFSTYEDKPTEPKYLQINRKLKEENKQLIQTIDDLKKQIAKMSESFEKIINIIGFVKDE